MKETTNSAVTAIQRIGTGLIMILVPAFLIVGFSAHPNLGNLSPLKSAADWVSEFRHNAIWGHAHMGVLFITPLFIPIIMGLKRLSERKAPWHALIGSSLAILGVALLAMDKGAVYMVPSAMESLSDQQFVQAMPVIEALFNKEGAFIAPVPFTFTIYRDGNSGHRLIEESRHLALEKRSSGDCLSSYAKSRH